jgi:hypothetical protein
VTLIYGRRRDCSWAFADYLALVFSSRAKRSAVRRCMFLTITASALLLQRLIDFRFAPFDCAQKLFQQFRAGYW